MNQTEPLVISLQERYKDAVSRVTSLRGQHSKIQQDLEDAEAKLDTWERAYALSCQEAGLTPSIIPLSNQVF